MLARLLRAHPAVAMHSPGKRAKKDRFDASGESWNCPVRPRSGPQRSSSGERSFRASNDRRRLRR